MDGDGHGDRPLGHHSTGSPSRPRHGSGGRVVTPRSPWQAVMGAALGALAACGAPSAGTENGEPPPVDKQPTDTTPEIAPAIAALSPESWPAAPEDVSNKYADDPAAALLGQRLFFDTSFSGPLLDT